MINKRSLFYMTVARALMSARLLKMIGSIMRSKLKWILMMNMAVKYILMKKKFKMN